MPKSFTILWLIFLCLIQTVGSANAAPTIAETIPGAQNTVRELTSIEVVFDGNVSGVDAGDLLINGVPASKITMVSPRDYVFGFSQPPAGDVRIDWQQNHGITDWATPPAPFEATGWSYTLDLSEPPAQVTISEFMADNEHGIRDDDGNHSDWLELFNAGSLPVNLGGWFLTDSANDLTKWRLPAVNISENSYLLIWASGKNRTNLNTPLHTNFKLEKNSGFLALVDSKTNIVSQFSPGYPVQRTDISYGRDTITESLVGYFSTPTPGARNMSSGPGFAPEPSFSLEGGVFTNSSITIQLTASSGQIHYTFDGSAPTASSPVYASPIVLSSSTVVKARVFQAGLLPSTVVGKNYTLIDSSVARFSSTLPLVIVTAKKGIASDVLPGQPRTFASLVAFDTFRGRSAPSLTPDYLGSCEMEIRGQTSSGFPKQPYNLELQDAYRNDLKVPLLGLPAGSDWVLNNPYSDKPFLQNFLAQELFEKMGHYAVRRRFVEVFVNTAGGRVSYPRDYVGIYLLLEKIRVDEKRVDIASLNPYDNQEPNISGGYIFKKDKDSAGDLNFQTSGGGGFSGQALKIHEPKPREITSQQLNWLTSYLNRFERALYASNWKTAAGTNHYSAYIDVDSFVDFHWIVEFSKQIDGYRLSNYMHKDRSGKIQMGPIWDWNLSFGNADYLDGMATSGWYYQLLGENDHIWLRRLISGTTAPNGTSGDPDFNQRITDRWSVLRTNVFAASNILSRIDEMAALLDEPAARDFQKWPRLGTYVWPNPPIYANPRTFQGVISAMKNWIQGRYSWIDRQFLSVPTFSQPGGSITNGFNLTISASAGDIYYTTDGSDPRLSGGAISSKAVRYGGPVTIQGNSQVFARARSGQQWSGPTVGTFVIGTPALVITEIMYHPADPPAGGLFDTEDFEYLEFMNRSGGTLDLAGFQITNGVSFTFPKIVLAPQERVLVVKNQRAFESRYGIGLPIAGEFEGNLDNSGERIVVVGAAGEAILDFSYRDDWYPIANGHGFSLVLNGEETPVTQMGEKQTWRQSSALNGSPDSAEAAPLVFPEVVISEALTHPGESESNWIELQNLSSQPADIGGWFLTDNFNDPRKFRISGGTQIPPGGFIVFGTNDFGSAAKAINPFKLSTLGEEVYLFSGDSRTNLTGYVHGFKFGAQASGISFGRYVNSTGLEQFVSQWAKTLNTTNSGPLLSPVVITEIMYHPPDVFMNAAYWNNTEDEYIELFNRTDQAVSLFGAQVPTNTWKLSGQIDFAFPSTVILAPRSYVVLASFDPVQRPDLLTAFRDKYQIAANVSVLGPFQGALDNHGGTITLSVPESGMASNAGTNAVPYILAEKIEYASLLPWPSGADGDGFALNRIDPDAFGNDAGNWAVRVPTPGRASEPNNELRIGAITVQGQITISFSAAANHSYVVEYTDTLNPSQWSELTEIEPRQTNFTATATDNVNSATRYYRVVDRFSRF